MLGSDVGDAVDVGAGEEVSVPMVAVGKIPLPVPVGPPNPVLREYGYGGSVSLSHRG